MSDTDNAPGRRALPTGRLTDHSIPQVCNQCMPQQSTVQDVRRANLLALQALCGTTAELERRSGVSYQYLDQLIKRRPHSKSGIARLMGNLIARRLEQAFNLPSNSMDHPHATANIGGTGSRGEGDQPEATNVAPRSMMETWCACKAARLNAPWPFRGIAPLDWAALNDGDRAAIETYARALCDKCIVRSV